MSAHNGYIFHQYFIAHFFIMANNFIHFYSNFTQKSAFSEIFYNFHSNHTLKFLSLIGVILYSFPILQKNLHFLVFYNFHSNHTLKFLSLIGVILYSFPILQKNLHFLVFYNFHSNHTLKIRRGARGERSSPQFYYIYIYYESSILYF